MTPEIQKGVPIPDEERYHDWKGLILQMQPGDSVVLSTSKAYKLQQTVSANYKQFRMVTRAEGANTRRCWLLERKEVP